MKKENDFPCTVTSWQKTGYQDGSRGYSAKLFNNHRAACGSEGVQAKKQEYVKGYVEGIEEYCSPYRAVIAGTRQEPYLGNCPKKLEPIFMKRYFAGKRIRQINGLIASRRENLARLKGEIRNVYTDLEKRRIQRQVNFIIDEIGALEKEKKKLSGVTDRDFNAAFPNRAKSEEKKVLSRLNKKARIVRR